MASSKRRTSDSKESLDIKMCDVAVAVVCGFSAFVQSRCKSRGPGRKTNTTAKVGEENIRPALSVGEVLRGDCRIFARRRASLRDRALSMWPP